MLRITTETRIPPGLLRLLSTIFTEIDSRLLDVAVDLRELMELYTPLESGEAASKWTPVEAVSKGYSFGNDAPYLKFLEQGSIPGRRPWKGLGEKTVLVDGRIYSSQAPGGIYTTAGADKFIAERLTKLVEKVVIRDSE